MNSHLTEIVRDDHHRSDVANTRVKFDLILKEVADIVAPVWPLKDYVAVNPYFGLANRNFMSARAFLRVFSACETLMPLSYYAGEWQAGRITRSDIETALGNCPGQRRSST